MNQLLHSRESMVFSEDELSREDKLGVLGMQVGSLSPLLIRFHMQ